MSGCKRFKILEPVVLAAKKYQTTQAVQETPCPAASRGYSRIAGLPING
jgi:hypothetical protein